MNYLKFLNIFQICRIYCWAGPQVGPGRFAGWGSARRGRPQNRPSPGARPGHCPKEPASRPAQTESRPGRPPSQPAPRPAQAGSTAGARPRHQRRLMARLPAARTRGRKRWSGRGLERSGPHPGVVSVDGDGEGAADGDDREIDRARPVRRCCGSRRRSGRSRIDSLVGQGEEVTARLTAALDLLLGGSSGGEARATATVSRRPQSERESAGKGAGEGAVACGGRPGRRGVLQLQEGTTAAWRLEAGVGGMGRCSDPGSVATGRKEMMPTLHLAPCLPFSIYKQIQTTVLV